VKARGRADKWLANEKHRFYDDLARARPQRTIEPVVDDHVSAVLAGYADDVDAQW